jgi:hypothetical protein
MTLPTGEPVPEREPPRKGIVARLAGALLRTVTGSQWSWAEQVPVDDSRGQRDGREPVTAAPAQHAPSRRDTWIGAGIVAVALLGCAGALQWWVR